MSNNTEKRNEIINVVFKYKDGMEIQVDMNRKLDYEIVKIKMKKGEEIIEYDNIEELYVKDVNLLDRVIKSHVIWLLYNFNRELIKVKDEGMKFTDMIDSWIEAVDDILSPSLLATTFNPEKKEAIIDAINTLIESYNEIIIYLHEKIKSHCKRLSKYIKGLHRFKKMERTRQIFYEVYNYWLGSKHRDEALKDYESYGIEKILMDFLALTVKFRLMDISPDPFEKLNYLAGINLRICRIYDLLYPILNSHLNILEHMKDVVSNLDEVTPADIDKVYDKISEVADETTKASISLKGIYVNLEPL